MNGIIDLHIHSTASDGSLTPEKLVRQACEIGLCAIALTDHDTVEGVHEALEAGKANSMEVIPGVEISTVFEPEMHILGYFTPEKYSLMDEILVYIREKRKERNPKIIERLNGLGIHITMEDVLKESTGDVTGRAHIAAVMKKAGYVNSIKEAFDKYLAFGQPAYTERERLTPEQGIEAILRCGGVPVLAHPKYLRTNMEEIENIIKELMVYGLKGIEAIYGENTDDETRSFLNMAKRLNLLVTGGSDFHGDKKDNVMLGTGKGRLAVPYYILEELKKALY